MSNQSSGSVSGKADEPSMEDILASIRQMISEDDAPMESAVETQTPEPETSLEPSALVQPVETPASEETPPSPIRDIAAPSQPKPVAMETPDVPEPDFSFEAFETDLDFEGDLVIPDAPDVSAAEDDTSGEDLIDIDELIAEVESRVDQDVKAATEDLDAADLAVSSAPNPTDNTDIELVKSLMADLTDDASDDDLAEEAEDTELSQILGELSDIQSDNDLAVEIDITGDNPDDFNSLLQIAQEAKAEANAFTLGTGATLAEELPQLSTDTSLTDTADAVTNDLWAEEVDLPALDVEITKQETPPMTNAAEDTIVGTEIEEATSSAFASLASVVERKDEVVTSGPAIGDLVKEALQPMLKDWLDKNLKGIVERSVAKEIKRISDTK